MVPAGVSMGARMTTSSELGPTPIEIAEVGPSASAEADAEATELIDIPLEVEAVGEGARLDRYLVRRFGRLSRHRVHQMIADARVLCLETHVALTKKSSRLRKGQRLLIRKPAPQEPDVVLELRFVHADADLLVIDKPGGLPVHPTARYHHHTLTALVRQHFGPDHGWELAHRLDRETSGVLLLGRNRKSATTLKQGFFRRKIQKTYIAAVHGHLDGSFDMHDSLGPAHNSEIRIKMGPRAIDDGGLMAHTHFEAIARAEFRGQPITLVCARPHTGRTHQIRVHLDLAGHPIVGDKLYGLPEAKFIEVADGHRPMAELDRELGLARHALHARGLEFRHPTHETTIMRPTVPWPQELAQLMDPARLEAWFARRSRRKSAESFECDR